MTAITKKPSKLRLEFVANTDSSVYGGLPAIEGLRQQFGLWKKLCAVPGLDPRVRKGRGFGPEVIVAQLIYSFCSGGASLSDSEDLNKEPLARLLANVPFFADQTTVGEWLRAQSPESIAGMWQVTQEFVRWVMQVKTLFSEGNWGKLGSRGKLGKLGSYLNIKHLSL
jgi:hypothetical protein